MTKKLKIAFQGEPGANSHIAIVEAYPDAEPLPCATFEDALSAISSGEADLGMIPIENSVAGRVADIHHLLPHSGLFIVGEWFLPIRHQLMAVRGTKLTDIKTVEGLKGKRIGISHMGAPPFLFASRVLANHNVDPKNDVTWITFPSDAMELALNGGEDYELVLVGPEEKLLAVGAKIDVPLTIIGRMLETRGGRVGLVDRAGEAPGAVEGEEIEE